MSINRVKFNALDGRNVYNLNNLDVYSLTNVGIEEQTFQIPIDFDGQNYSFVTSVEDCEPEQFRFPYMLHKDLASYPEKEIKAITQNGVTRVICPEYVLQSYMHYFDTHLSENKLRFKRNRYGELVVQISILVYVWTGDNNPRIARSNLPYDSKGNQSVKPLNLNHHYPHNAKFFM